MQLGLSREIFQEPPMFQYFEEIRTCKSIDSRPGGSYRVDKVEIPELHSHRLWDFSTNLL